MSTSIVPEPFRRLGVRAGLNCSGTNTRYGGTRVWPEVREAMDAVTGVDVYLAELNEKAGKYLADVCGAEAGFVSSGAAGGMTLQAAACMAGTDTSKILRLPDTQGMKSEIPIYRGHRTLYDQAWLAAGATLVEYGDVPNCDPQELEEVIGPNTAAVAYVVSPGLQGVALPLEEVCSIAHRQGVPVIVDAAGMLPPRANLRRYLEQGADLVTFSGGKGVRGPQGSGILVGRRDLIEAAVANASPHHGVARAAKITKEEIVGLVTALDVMLRQDEEAEFLHWSKQSQYIVDVLREISGVSASIECDGVEWVIPMVVINLKPDWRGASREQVVTRLREGDPPIFIGQARLPESMYIKTINLSDQDVELVASRLLEALTGPVG